MEKYDILKEKYKIPPQGVWEAWDEKQKRKFLKLQNYVSTKQDYPVCAIDVETTGLDPSKHALIQIAIVPLDRDFYPLDVEPFYHIIAPEGNFEVTKEAMKVNGLDMEEIMLKGLSPAKAIVLLDEWIKKLQVKRLIPLGQQYSFDEGFIKTWLGDDKYGKIFARGYRDTKTVALFLNDLATVKGQKKPFERVNNKVLTSVLKVSNEKAHDALSDARATAEVYRKMIEMVKKD